MTTVARPITAPVKSGESVSTRLVEFTHQAPVHLALILISVIWLVPTVDRGWRSVPVLLMPNT